MSTKIKQWTDEHFYRRVSLHSTVQRLAIQRKRGKLRIGERAACVTMSISILDLASALAGSPDQQLDWYQQRGLLARSMTCSACGSTIDGNTNEKRHTGQMEVYTNRTTEDILDYYTGTCMHQQMAVSGWFVQEKLQHSCRQFFCQIEAVLGAVARHHPLVGATIPCLQSCGGGKDQWGYCHSELSVPARYLQLAADVCGFTNSPWGSRSSRANWWIPLLL